MSAPNQRATKSAMSRSGAGKSQASGGAAAPGFRLMPNILTGAFILILVAALVTEFLIPLPDPFHPPTGLRWWFTPFERNAFMRVSAVDEPLNAVDAMRGTQLVWAVGDHGLIIRSTDGGHTWSRSRVEAPKPAQAGNPPPPPTANFAEPRDLQSEYDKQLEAKRALENARVKQNTLPNLDTSPAQKNARSPEREPSTTAVARNAFFNNQSLWAVDFADEQRGVAVGDEGIILVTNDGGATWKQSESGYLIRLRAIAFSDIQRAVAIGAGGRTLVTRDGGESWTLGNDVLVGAVAVAFDGANGIAVGDFGYVAHTTDGGEAWTLADSGLKGIEGSLRSVAFTAPGRAIAVGDKVSVETVNGGQTWTLATDGTQHVVKTAISAGMRSVSAAKDQNAVAVSKPGGLVFTEDAGATWTIGAIAPGAGLRDVAFANDHEGAALGPSGAILFTRDGGESWSVAKADEPFKAIGLSADGHGFALTEENGLFVTADAGYTWISKATNRALPLGDADLVALDAERAFIASGRIYYSIDGGGVWLEAAAPANESTFSGIAVADASRGVVVGSLAPISYTLDGGRSWRRSNHQVRNNLTHVALAPSGWGAAVGSNGTVLHTKDGGVNWAPALSNTQAALTDVAFDKSRGGLRGVAVGVDGTILSTSDGGLNWTPRASNTDLDFLSTAFAGEGRVVALSAGRILLSTNGGETWAPVRYRRVTSPWLPATIAILLGGVLWQMQRRRSTPMVVPREAGIEDSGASDRPIRWGDPDHLGLKDIALGLSRFLRNRRTEPPLTIAITGEWGTGKSSLMNLLHDNLRTYGFQPVWFNAWHHQSGENLLGSLLANIREQGVPPFLSVAGLDYFWTLLVVRARRFWFRVAVTVFLFAAVLSYYLTHHVPPLETLTSLFSTDVDFSDKTGALGLVLAIVTAIGGAWRALSAFGMKPDKLIAAVATSSNDETSRLEAGARYRFSREFADFSRALDPRTLVIFIDDLDRCRPENVVEVLEAVNFLISSGPCIVVLGMAPRWVETCVGLAFKELAEASSLAEANEDTPAHEPDREDTSSIRDQQDFARKYLEKLINIQVAVPKLTQKSSLAILRGDDDSAPPQTWRHGLGTAIVRTAQASVVVLALALLLGGAYFVARALPEIVVDSEQASAATAAVTQPAPPPVTSSATPAPQTGVSSGPSSQASARGELAGFDSGQQPRMSSWFAGGDAVIGIMLVVLILLTLGTLVALIAFVRGSIQTEDSPRFQKALEIMQPWIVLGGDSPRSIKRFMNHLRYAAMRFQTVEEPPSEWERVKTRVLEWFERVRKKRPRPGEQEEGLRAPVLVALASIHRCGAEALDEGQWATRDVIIKLVLDKFYEGDKKQEGRTELDSRLRSSLVQFNAEFREDELFEDAAEDRKRIARFRKIIAAAARRGLEGDTPPPSGDKRAASQSNDAP